MKIIHVVYIWMIAAVLRLVAWVMPEWKLLGNILVVVFAFCLVSFVVEAFKSNNFTKYK